MDRRWEARLLIDHSTRVRRSSKTETFPTNQWIDSRFLAYFAVTAMLICYALEDRSPWFILAFAIARALGSAYGFLQGAWPFGLVEAVWSLVPVRRWRLAKSN